MSLTFWATHHGRDTWQEKVAQNQKKMMDRYLLKLPLLCSVPQTFLSLPWTSCIFQHEGCFCVSVELRVLGLQRLIDSWGPRAAFGKTVSGSIVSSMVLPRNERHLEQHGLDWQTCLETQLNPRASEDRRLPHEASADCIDSWL